METVMIEKKTFEELLSKVKTLIKRVNTLCHQSNDKKMSKWLDGEEVCQILRINQRTLQTLRDNQRIDFTQINRKFYYKPAEVQRLLETCPFKKERDYQ